MNDEYDIETHHMRLLLLLLLLLSHLKRNVDSFLKGKLALTVSY